MIKSYQDLTVWQKAMDLVVTVYRLLPEMPGEERFALADQMRRAAVSVPANIAEGYGRRRDNELKHFLKIAQGSLAELQTHLYICERVQLLAKADIAPVLTLSEEVAKMLHAFEAQIDHSQP